MSKDKIDYLYKTDLSIQDIEKYLKVIDYKLHIGEVSPGCYQIGKGVYTGYRGYKRFVSILNDKMTNTKPENWSLTPKSSIKELLQTKEKVSKKKENI